MRRSPASRRFPFSRLTLAALLLPAAGLLTAATPSQTFQQDPDRLVMATAHWSNRAQLQKIAGHFQHLIVDEKARTARVEASAADLDKLRRMGVRVEIDDAQTTKLRKAEAAISERMTVRAENAIPGFACYRTVEETYATMDQLASRHPTLARVQDIGPTWTWTDTNGASGYRMRVLRLNNTATDATVPDKPNMVVLAAVHARELTTAELSTRFAEWLVNGYGTDNEATWLLDNFRFHFILQGNPDGRKRAESGLSWRKNTNTDNGVCSANAYGVDLNRNFSWRFGTVSGGSSGDACDATYRGPAAMSEDEVRNVMRYVVGTPGAGGTYTGGVFADRRTDTGTAPSDYRGLFLDIHSFSQLVLWPWAYTSVDAPNAIPLQTLGRRLAYFNQYRPVQWTGLYAADGTNTDTVYGITGAPSYTIELGQEFFEDCSTFQSTTYPRNFNAMKYAARNLQQPYLSPSGPDTTSAAGSAPGAVRGRAYAVSGWFDDSTYNQSNGTEAVQAITGASAWLDRAPWAAGAVAAAMRPSDGTFDSSREQAVINIDTRNLAYGKHVVYVRGTDASGRAGTPSAVYFLVRRPLDLAPHDFDGDLRADLVWRNASTGRNVMWRGANSSQATNLASVASSWKIVAQGDFDGDGRSDLFWRNSSTGINSLWRSANSATQLTVATVADAAWRVVGAGDFDGDGRSDLFWRNVRTGANTIWRSANAATQIAVNGVGGTGWQVVGVGDFDADTRSDVLWRNVESGANTIWRGGSAASQMAVATVASTAWKVVGVADFDGNGAADIFWRNNAGGNTIWRGGNAATPISTAGAAPAWRVASVGDFDADGYADVQWRNTQTGANVIWKRANNTTALTLTATSTPWTVEPYENQP